MNKFPFLALLALAACARNPEKEGPAEPTGRTAEGAGGAARADRGPGHAEGHAAEDSHDHVLVSDLDRPVAELFAETCEHGKKTYTCDECRYGVGVVKAGAELFSGGLLERVLVARRPLTAPLDLTGEVRFDERRVVHLSSLAEGIIRKAFVTQGDRVRRGDALVEIEAVAVGEAEADYLQAKGLLELARQSHERLAALGQEGISSARELLAARQELEAARIRAEAALGKLTRLGMNAALAGNLTQASADGRLVLRSPADGTVLHMHAVAGEIARAETALITVGDNTALWVWADLYERDVAAITRVQARAPLAAEVEVRAFPTEVFSGVVDFVSPSMDEATRTIKLRIAVLNPNGKLLSGMFAKVRLLVPGSEEVLAVPEKAVLEDEGRRFVFVHHEGDYYVRRPVEVGRTFGPYTEIARGLSGGEAIVAEGAFLLKSDVLRSKMGAGCAD